MRQKNKKQLIWHKIHINYRKKGLHHFSCDFGPFLCGQLSINYMLDAFFVHVSNVSRIVSYLARFQVEVALAQCVLFHDTALPRPINHAFAAFFSRPFNTLIELPFLSLQTNHIHHQRYHFKKSVKRLLTKQTLLAKWLRIFLLYAHSLQFS